MSKYPKSIVRGSGQGRCEQRIEVFVKIQKYIIRRAGVGVGGGGCRFWGQGGCDQEN